MTPSNSSRTTMADVPPSICEALLNVLVDFGVHAQPPRGIAPPRLVVALYEAASAHYEPVIEKATEIGEHDPLNALATLAAAGWLLPIKQHDRSDAEQAHVEAWTSAMVEARALLRDRGREVPDG